MPPKDYPLPEIFFDTRSNGYWMRLTNGRFLPLDKSSVNLHLRRAGLSTDAYVGYLNELEAAIVKAQLEKGVEYAGPLSGHRCGLFNLASGEKILVTSEARSDVFEPIPTDNGPCEFIDKYLGQLFGSEQLDHVLGWLRIARISLARRDFRPGQMLVLAGPSGCGKSLFHAFVTEILGGRSGKPYRYMIGETNFNSELASSEHLVIEDESASTDIRARRKFGASIKDFTVNELMSIHAKGRPAIMLPVYKRVTLSVNDEAENLMILPPLDASIGDKIMLLKCSRAELPDDRKVVWGNIVKEMPAFLSFLNRWRISKRVQPAGEDIRYGVAHYHHPALLELVSHISPESRLRSLIDEVIVFTDGPFCGTADALEMELRKSPFSPSVSNLLYYSSACDVYLARLAQKEPERFKRQKFGTKIRWIITAPAMDQEQAA